MNHTNSQIPLLPGGTLPFWALVVFVYCLLTGFQENPNYSGFEKYLHKALSFSQTNPDSVFHYVDLLEAVSTKDELLSRQKTIYYLKTGAHRLQGNLRQATLESIKAKKFIGRLPLDTIDAEILFLSAQLYTDIGQYDNALQEYRQAMKFYNNLDHPEGEGKCFNSIALIYYRINDLENAQEYNDRALKVWEIHPNPLGLAASANLNGYIQAETGNFDEAIAYLELAQGIYMEIEDKERYANSFLNIGEVYLTRGDYLKAEETIQSSLDISQNLKYTQIYVDGFNKLGQCYTKQGNYQLAEKTLKEGLRQAETIQDRALLAEFYEHLAELFQASGNFEEAYGFQKKFESQKDSIFESERALRIAEFEVQYEMEEITRENESLQKTNRQRLRYLGLLSVLVLLAVALTFFVYSRYRYKIKFLQQEKALNETKIREQKLENEKLQMEVDYKRKELSSTTLHLYQKNENLNQLLDEINRLEKKVENTSKRDFQQLKRSVRQNLNLDEDWERFQLHFDQVHEGFIEKLFQTFPALSNQDLRHCAYMRMNLSTKEISRLLNITPSSVQKSRVRLKKKLGLGKEINLFDFILKF